MRLRWRNKLLIGFVIFAIVPAGLVAYFAFDTFHRTSRKASLSSLEGLVRAKAEAIDQFTISRTLDVDRLAGLLAGPVTKLKAAEEEVRAVVPKEPVPSEPLPLDDAGKIRNPSEGAAVPEKAPEPEPEEPKAKVNTLAEEVRNLAHSEVKRTLGLLLGQQATFEELLVIARDGRVVASTFSEHEGKTASEVEYYKRGRAATFVQPVFQSPITNELTMVIATPIRDANNEEVGVLAARLNLRRFFRLINDNTGLGLTGETLVGRIMDKEVVLMAPTRHDPDAALKRRIPLDSHRIPIVAAARGDSGARVSTDHRGVKVLAAWTFVPSLEWGIVTKIDLVEANEPLVAVQTRLILITLVVMGLAIIASLIFAGAIVRPLRDLRNATDKISKGDLDVELAISPGDELGELADSFERMVAAIKFFRDSHRESESEESEEDEESSAERRPSTRA